jgi:hypothetical protein
MRLTQRPGWKCSPMGQTCRDDDVSSANLLSASGNPERHRRVRQVLAGDSIGKAPPPTRIPSRRRRTTGRQGGSYDSGVQPLSRDGEELPPPAKRAPATFQGTEGDGVRQTSSSIPYGSCCREP